jgi:hypothetical protein
MTSHASVAAKVRADKEEHPEKYCSNAKCLWHVVPGVTECRKHALPVWDVRIQNEGSLVLFVPLTDRANEWLTANTDGQWMGSYGLAVEPRCALNLAAGLREAGFTVRA